MKNGQQELFCFLSSSLVPQGIIAEGVLKVSERKKIKILPQKLIVSEKIKINNKWLQKVDSFFFLVVPGQYPTGH